MSAPESEKAPVRDIFWRVPVIGVALWISVTTVYAIDLTPRWGMRVPLSLSGVFWMVLALVKAQVNIHWGRKDSEE